MAINAEQLNIILAARDKEFTKAMDRSQRRVETFAKKSQGSLSRTSKSLDALGSAARRLAPLLAGAFSLRAISNTINTAVQIGNLSAVAGVSTDRFQELAFASKAFGVEQEKLSDILKDVNDKFGDYVQTGAGPLKDFFEFIAPQVGLTAEAFADLSSADKLGKYISALETANVSQADMTFYLEAIASDATLLERVFADNGAELDRLSGKLRNAGGVMDRELIANSREAREEIDLASTAIRANLSVALAEILPIITAAAEGVAGLATNIGTFIDQISHLGSGSDLGYYDQILEDAKEYNEALREEIELVERLMQRFETIANVGEGGSGITSDAGLRAAKNLKDAAQALRKEYDRIKRDTPSFSATIAPTTPPKTDKPETDDKAIKRVTDLSKKYRVLTDDASDLASVMGTVENSMESAFMSMVDGTASASDAFKSMAAEIIKELYRVLVVQQLVSSIMGALGFGGGTLPSGVSPSTSLRPVARPMASGGAAQAGQPYVTGEHGRELFVPKVNGRILSAAQTNNLSGGGGDGITVVQNNTFGNGVTRSEVNAMLPKMVEATKAAVADAKLRGGSYGGAFS